MYNVLIIGAGSIGALKPDKYDSPITEAILTHAHAVTEHSEFNLQIIMDTDYEKMMKAANKWDCIGCTTLDVINENNIDVVVIATPTKTHLEIYHKIKNWNLKAIIIEKPCTNNLKDCREMKDDKRIIINYSRRYLSFYKELRKNFEIQKILSCVIRYVRGLKRDGCHAIDLCRYFFGEIEDVKKLSVGPDDYSAEDTTDCIWMKAERCPNIVMIPSDGRIADCFDFHIMTYNGMVELLDHGGTVFYRNVRKETEYGDYYILEGKRNENFKTIDLQLSKKLLLSLYNYIHEIIQGCENNLCTIQDAIETHRIIETIRG